MALGAEGVDEIGDEIFCFGAAFEDFFFVFDDNFVVGDFDDFFAGDGEFGVREALNEWAFDDDLLDVKIVSINGEIYKLTEFRALSGLDFEGEGIEIKLEDLFDMNDVVRTDEFINVVDDHAVIGIFADRIDVEDVILLGDEGADETKSNNLEIIGVDDGGADLADGTTGLDT